MWRVIGIIVATIVGLLALAVVGLATPPGRALVAELVSRAASGDDLTVTIEGLSGWPPFRFGAERIVLADADGEFAEVDHLAVDARLTALFTGTIAADSISAERVAIARPPRLSGGSGGGGNLLPFAVDALSVVRLELGAGLAGRPAILSLAGAAAAGADGSLSADLSAERIDGTEGKLAVLLKRAGGSAPLTADVRLSEGANGILVGLMGRASGPGYALTLSSDVSGDTVSGTASLKSEGAARFDGRFSLAPVDGGGQTLVLDGSGDLAELVPPGYADLLSGAIDVAIDADVVREAGKALPQLAIRRGTVTTGSVRAEASGTLGEANANLTLKLDVAKAGGGPIAVPGLAVYFDTVSLTGTVAPKGDALRLELTGKATGFTANGMSVPALGASLAVEARGDDPLASRTLPFALRLEADALQTETGRIEAAAGAPLVLSADGTLDAMTLAAKTTAKLVLAGGTTDFAGTLSSEGVAGKATVAYGDLTPLSAFAGRAFSGALTGTVDGTFAGPDGLNLAIAATATDLDPGNRMAAKLLAGKAEITAKLTRPLKGPLAVSDLGVSSAAFKATGAVSLGDGTIDGNLWGTIADLALLADASSGAATFSASVSGAPAMPTVDAHLGVARGELLGKAIDNATATFRAAPTDGGWQGSLALDGGFGGKPLTGTATAELDTASGRIAFPAIDVSVGGNRITGALTRTAAGPLQGTLSVDAPDLATLAALALVDASGAASADIDFVPDGAQQAISVTFAGNDLTLQSVAAGTLNGSARIADLFGVPTVEGDASATAMTVGGVHLDSASASASVADGTTTFQAKAKGPDVDLSGTGSIAAAALTIETLTGSAYGAPVKLAAPVAIALGGGAAGIANADLALGGGSVRVNGAVSPSFDLTIDVASVSASVINGFAPNLGAGGTISGRVTVTGRASALTYDWQANWSDLVLAATRSAGLPGLSLSARGKGSATATSIDATLGGAGLSLAVTGNVPFRGGNLDLNVNGGVPLPLLALMTDRELRLAGAAQVSLAVGGAFASPSVSGAIDLADATLADLASGLGITGASGRVAFDGRRATTSGITGRLSQGGDVTVSGSVSTDGAGLPADLTVRVTNGRYADGNLIKAQLGADLTFTGPLLGNGTLAGTIDLGRAEIQLPDKFGGAATAIDVDHVNAPPGFKPPQVSEPAAASGGAGGGDLNLAITLNAPNSVFVRGFGIDSELGGTLRLEGTSGSPQAVGAFTMSRGRIETLGKRFDFTRGSLTFSGDLLPRLDFAATTRTSDSVVTLHVSGPANDPTISFTSSPARPEEEILSRLLFDRSIGTLSPLQAAQLVDAVAQLTGATGGTSLFTRVRRATGLDNLDIRQNAAGGTTVGVGKRLGDRVEVGVEAGSGTAGGRVTIDLDITENLKARGEAGENGEGKVGLSFEKEY